MWRQRLMWITWPAFLGACLLEFGVFALVDPQDMYWLGHPLNLSRQGVYTISFFVFWAGTLLASGLAIFLADPPEKVQPDLSGRQDY